ncbi:MAG: S9 family peptidase [Xanthomonadaceae bacterium]|nr:S9 family peptidase [Xanthomonadaceae bacterium]
MKSLAGLVLVLAASGAAVAADAPQRITVGQRVSEGLPESVPADLAERLQRYQNTRRAVLADWSADGRSILIGTRFGNTQQVHRVRVPGGAREQLTFYDEPISEVVVNPQRDGFVFGKDTGGSEFWQLYWFDGTTGDVRLLTDGKSRNDGSVFSADGRLLAYSSTQRNGKDTDVWLRDLDTGEARPLVTKGGKGSWQALDFAADGKQLLVVEGISANESHPYIIDVAGGEPRPLLPAGREPAAIGNLHFSADASRVYFTSDSGSEFQQLRVLEIASGKVTTLSASIPWDIETVALSRDGRHLAFVANEDGVSALHLLDLADGKPLPLPSVPAGVIDALHFSPDGTRLGFTLASATSPADVYSMEIGTGTVTRWTESEIGGLNSSTFVSPELVRFPTFDKVGGKPRTIPAFYYRPKGDGPFPSVVLIHGGPESQSRPVFNPDIQFLASQLGVAVLVPNVRGSTGYGKTYVKLDNGFKREDSVRDIGALLDWIGTRSELDAGRVGVIGGSYGGYMVLAVMTHYSERLRAGVEIVGISNFNTFLANTEDYRRDLRRAEYGDERDPKMRAFFDKISPLNNAERIQRPLFVAQGANDPRVPATEAEQIVERVRHNGGTVWYLLQKDEGHGFQKKANRDFYTASTMQFWQKYLIGEAKQ